MAHVPSLPPELVRIIARFTEPGAWSTARALSKVWREAIHERTKDPAALDELLLHMHNRGVCPLMIIYGEDDPQSALLERHFPRQEFATNVHHGFVRLSMSLMLDLAQYVPTSIHSAQAEYSRSLGSCATTTSTGSTRGRLSRSGSVKSHIFRQRMKKWKSILRLSFSRRSAG